jgi:16S rRNA (cytosine967-C5)-methyltransferase
VSLNPIRPTARSVAWRLLQQNDAPGDFLEHRLETDTGAAELSPADRRLVQELVYGVTRQRAALDWIIARRTDGRVQRPPLQHLLRLGTYQLFFLDRIPVHAAVNETVQLARDGGFASQSGFINAVLRGLERERATLRAELTLLRQREPATGWSHPAWLVERWSQFLDPAALVRFLEWNNQPPGVHARLNALRATPEQLLEMWRQEGVNAVAQPAPWAPDLHVFRLDGHPPLTSLPSFRSGAFYVQDPSTVLAVAELAPRAGERVLDLCAAPGGKTTLAAQLMANTGELIAHDADGTRLRLVRENCDRLGVTCVRVTDQVPEGLFDRVLVDAPCSNTGVLRRRVELRWRLRSDEIARLAALQRDLLTHAAERVRPGGTLVYSTCSVEPEENGAVAIAFTNSHPEFALEKQHALLPWAEGVDGAFVARWRRAG